MDKILVVEDDHSLARGIEFALEEEGYTAVIAETIAEAENNYSVDRFDLLLLDVLLPDGSGFDFCKNIRKSSTIPVIFLTARDEEVNIVQGLDIGADDYITKPFRVRELLSRIKAVLRRHTPQQAQQQKEIIRGSDLSLDVWSHTAMLNGQKLALTPLEFKLLHILLENKGHALSRERILERIWDIEGDYIDDNTLSVHIRRLREKIETDPSNPQHIITVRGLGYKWEDRKVK